MPDAPDRLPDSFIGALISSGPPGRYVANGRPVIRSYASMYRRLVASMTSRGRLGDGGFLSQRPSSQSLCR